MKNLFFVFIILLAGNAFSKPAYKFSAKRDPAVSYEQKINEFKSVHKLSDQFGRDNESVVDVKLPFDKVDFTKVKPWLGTIDFETFFNEIRDERLMKKESNFPRRLTWLYPDDGCYARADVVSHKARHYDFSGGSKIYAFGNLKVKTLNNPNGYVTWWYHVVTGYKVNDQVYVVDPAISPDAPMRVEDWLGSMGDIHRLKISICDTGAYSPENRCNEKLSRPLEYALINVEDFLSPEWNRVSELGRNPKDELGEKPPWKK